MYPLSVGIVIGNRRVAEEVRGALEDLSVSVMFRQPDMADVPRFLDVVQRFHPDLLIIELAVLPRPFEEVLRKIRHTPVAPLIIALNDSADPEAILAAVRGGAGEYLFPPLAPGLRTALERMGEERARTSPVGRVGGRTVGFLSAKGGCGATTLACHVAAAIQRATAQEVLLADLDLESGMVSFLMKTHVPYSIVDAASNTHRLDLSFWKALVAGAGPRFDVAGAPVAAIPRGELSQHDFRKVLRFLRSAYDWAIVDLGRSLELFSVNLMEELDEAFLVANMDLPSLHQTKQILQALADAGYRKESVHLVLNRMPKRPDISIAEVEKLLSVPVYGMVADHYAELHEALAQGELAPPGSGPGKQFEHLARQIAGLAPDDAAGPKPRFSFSIH